MLSFWRIRWATPSGSSNCPDRTLQINATRPMSPIANATGTSKIVKFIFSGGAVLIGSRVDGGVWAKRKLLVTTTIEEPDMAMAAATGVIGPAIARGTAMQL